MVTTPMRPVKPQVNRFWKRELVHPFITRRSLAIFSTRVKRTGNKNAFTDWDSHIIKKRGMPGMSTPSTLRTMMTGHNP